MSLWTCPKCGVLTGPETGLCPKGCGVQTEYTTVGVSVPLVEPPWAATLTQDVLGSPHDYLSTACHHGWDLYT